MIKITRTQTLYYSVTDGDPNYYQENEVVNEHMAALCDLNGMEQGDFDWDDLESSATQADDVEYKLWIVKDVDDTEAVPVDESNKQRNREIFPEDVEEEEDADSEKPVAGELNAGGEAYGRV